MVPQKQWFDSSTGDPEQVKRLCLEWKTNPQVAEILLRRGYKTREEIKSFLMPNLSNLRDPYELRQMREAVNLLQDTIVNNRRIVILGDYDVDGITATALMLEFLQKCGNLNLDFFIPNRIKHGYGLTEASTDILLEMNPELVITVDNGITAAREVKRLNDEGIKTIVTDHHLADVSLLPSGIVVNPNHPECNYPFKKISGCGVALKLIMALRKSLRDSGWWTAERTEPNLRDSLDLAALGTVADVMPLVDENRILTHHGLLVMNEKPRLAIQVLQQLKKVNTITSRTLGFQFAPLLNAAGRLEDADMAVKFLLSNDLQEAETMAKKLDATNFERREKEGEMLETALALAETQKHFPALILTSPEFHEGINGIVATRLVERFYKPVLVLSEREEKLKGSGRSIPELHLKDALSGCSDLLERFGGHAAAAGCSLIPENLDAFRNRFFAFCREHIPESIEPSLKLDGSLEFPKLTDLFVEQLDRLQPFGEGNPEPLFSMETPELPFSLIKDKHVKWQLNGNVEIIGWNRAEMYAENPPSKLAVNLAFNEFRGRRKIQLTIQDSQV
ncbi:MAG TPA: single-stranded-DNA-specific exonuclease RecJ [Deltaproteobacteria bacterium]|nr:single-stranded-DNA-specific exonuclease RecJ [Deltaproteobacteria bacterium]